MITSDFYKKYPGFVLGTILFLSVTGVFLQLSWRSREAYRLVSHTYQEQSRLSAALLDVEQAQDAHEDYILNDNLDALVSFNTSNRQTFHDLDGLAALTAEEPLQTEQIKTLRANIATYYALLKAENNRREAAGPKGSMPLGQEFYRLAQVHLFADKIQQEERRALAEHIQQNRRYLREANLALAFLLVVITTLLAYLFTAVRRNLHQRMAAVRMQHDADQRVVDTLEKISDAFIALDHNWNFTYMNGEAERVLNKNRAEVIGQNLWTTHPDMAEDEFGREFRKAVSEKTTARFEAYYPPYLSWYVVNAYPTEDGLWVFFATSTTARRQKKNTLCCFAKRF